MLPPPPVIPIREFTWNRVAGRYIDSRSGRFVSFLVVRDQIELVMAAAQAEINAVTAELIAGEISLAAWQARMMISVKQAHIAAAVAARGGWAQMTQADWGWVGQRIKRQYQYLQRFAADVASGRQKLNGSLTVRAGMYAEAARGTFEEMRRREMTRAEFTEERRLLGQADHCQDSGERPGCVELAAKGWQPMGALPDIGEATCLTNCQCRFVYRRPGPDGAWIEAD